MKGILIIDKPEGWTSFDAVKKLRGAIRRGTSEKLKIGHGGTLDPLATGVLPVFIGREYTRLVSLCENMDKEYVAGLRLGIVTDTQDITGTVAAQSPVAVSRDDLERALGVFRGEILQVPPMYSAIKIGGERLYAVARRGGEIERAPRPITVYDAEIIGGGGADWTLRFVVSKGTYVRTLCHDIGRTLGCGGVMSALRRTRVGGFRVEDALGVVRASELAADGALGEWLIRDVMGLGRDNGGYK